MPFSVDFIEAMGKVVDGRPVRQIAEQTGFHRATIYEMLRGNAPRSPKRLEEFCQALGVTQFERDALFEAAGFVPVDTEASVKAAASELLAACKAIAPGIRCLGEQFHGRACGHPTCPACALHAAIAKAEGR